MKVCQNCGKEIATIDGENECIGCEDGSLAKRKQGRIHRQASDEAMESIGLVKVHGAMGGTYWE